MSIAFDNRPTPSEIEPVALDLIQRRGSEVLGIARRYAVSPEDAEDAYQRALEILLTKAPTTCADDLLPWLKTVVKHEAFALRRKRERDVPAEHDALDAFADEFVAPADERAERYDRLRVGAEALGRLKPQETRALLLKAEGLSYQEIAAQTGWTYTKVNRCLTEGRRAFFSRVAGIESGAECERLAPLLSALADGEASAEDMAALRPHLRGCTACRATLRDYRHAPEHVRDLGGAVVLGGGVLAWLGERVAGLVGWARGGFEAAAAHKAVAVVATSAAVAGGGAATTQAVDRDGSAAQPPAVVRAIPAAAGVPVVPAQGPTAATSRQPRTARKDGARRSPRARAQKPRHRPAKRAAAAPQAQPTGAAGRESPPRGAAARAPAPTPAVAPAQSPAPRPSAAAQPAASRPAGSPRPTAPRTPAPAPAGEFGP